MSAPFFYTFLLLMILGSLFGSLTLHKEMPRYAAGLVFKYLFFPLLDKTCKENVFFIFSFVARLQVTTA